MTEKNLRVLVYGAGVLGSYLAHKLHRGKQSRRSDPISRKGSGLIRKVLFQVMDIHLRKAPVDEPVFQFLDRKRGEGKPYYVYMTAGANKFLRIYYARVKEHLNSLGEFGG